MSFDLADAHDSTLLNLRRALPPSRRDERDERRELTQRDSPGMESMCGGEAVVQALVRFTGTSAQPNLRSLVSAFFGIGKYTFDFLTGRTLLDRVLFRALSNRSHGSHATEHASSEGGVYLSANWMDGWASSRLPLQAQRRRDDWVISGTVREVVSSQDWSCAYVTCRVAGAGTASFVLPRAQLDASKVHCQRDTASAFPIGSVSFHQVAIEPQWEVQGSAWPTQAALAMNMERMLLASFWVGVAEGLYEALVPVIRQQAVLGRPLAQFQSIRLAMSNLLLTAHTGRCLMLTGASALAQDPEQLDAGAVSLELFVADRLKDNFAELFSNIPRAARAGLPSFDRLVRDFDEFRALHGGGKLSESVLSSSLLKL